VLLALQAGVDTVDVPLRRAQAFAAMGGGALHITAVHRAAEGESVSAGSVELRMFEAERDIRRVCRTELQRALDGDQLQVVTGEFDAQIIATIRRLDADLAVLASHASVSRRAAEIARQTGASIVVARLPRSVESVLVATDLARPGYPVLRRVSELNVAPQTPVTLLHNLAPDEPAGVDAVAHLRRAGSALLPNAALVVTRRTDPADAILDHAAACDTDLIVVGIPRSGASGPLGFVAEDVVRRSNRTVLVTPLG
jgi:nucleotide-binding universal stress UspA family protein